MVTSLVLVMTDRGGDPTAGRTLDSPSDEVRKRCSIRDGMASNLDGPGVGT